MTSDLGPRPETGILEEEHLSVLLGDAIDGLESLQVPTPHQAIEDILSDVRFVRDRLMRLAAIKLGRVRC